MAEARIPVDLFNPGQVFACLGFLEAAEILLGQAEGGFDWSDEADVRFVLRAEGEADPVREVLGFLATARIASIEPAKRFGSSAETDDMGEAGGDDPTETDDRGEATDEAAMDILERIGSDTFPAPRPDEKGNALPVRLLNGDGKGIADLTHWWDGSGRSAFKLYSGNRSALKIARHMQRCITDLWKTDRDILAARPFDTLVAMGGSFNLDPRGAWVALDAGYSPDAQNHRVQASPVVELLAAWGLEDARPKAKGSVHHYAAWREVVPLLLARPAVACAPLPISMRRFCFELAYSGKNKIVTFAYEENAG